MDKFLGNGKKNLIPRLISELLFPWKTQYPKMIVKDDHLKGVLYPKQIKGWYTIRDS